MELYTYFSARNIENSLWSVRDRIDRTIRIFVRKIASYLRNYGNTRVSTK